MSQEVQPCILNVPGPKGAKILAPNKQSGFHVLRRLDLVTWHPRWVREPKWQWHGNRCKLGPIWEFGYPREFVVWRKHPQQQSPGETPTYHVLVRIDHYGRNLWVDPFGTSHPSLKEALSATKTAAFNNNGSRN